MAGVEAPSKSVSTFAANSLYVLVMSMIGTRVNRNEDPALLTVGGRYVDDLAPAEAAHLTFVRSVFPHALISSIDTSEAEAMPGVIGVYTAANLGLEAQAPDQGMLNQAMKNTWLASDRARFVGEPIVAVASETRNQGVDAAEMVFINYEELPVVLSLQDSAKNETLLYPDAGTNIAFTVPGQGHPEGTELETMFDDCEVKVQLKFRNHRLAPCPIETRAAVSLWGTTEDGRDHLTQWSETQGAHGTRDGLMKDFGLEKDQVRVICPDVGGAFGAKNGRYAEDKVVAAVARKLRRSIRWSETRSESMLGLVHGRACEFDCTIGGDRDGNIKAYSIHMTQDSGGQAAIGAVLPFLTKIMTTGVYDINRVYFTAISPVTNTVPVGAYRGAGRPEATHAIERMVDYFAAEIGMDPGDVRRKNLLAPEAFPLTTLTGASMDTGDYARSMDLAFEAANMTELRAEQERRRAAGDPKLIGIGLCTYVEITNPLGGGEFGSVEIKPDGSALALTGSSSHGQGHHTSFAQIVSELTGIDFDKIEVRHGDTDEVARGGGTGGSKSLQLGGTAIWQSTEQVIVAAKDVAAVELEANPDDIILDTVTGSFSVTGSPAISKSWAEVASAAAAASGANLMAESDFNPAGATFPFGTHVSVVEIDSDTGNVTVLRHVACDDAGVLVNPLLVDGQVHGGLASGIAHALTEEFSYDSDGNPVTATFMDYGIMSAAELPSFERVEMVTPTPLNPIGAKGIGEAGTIGATPAVQNAVIDAVAHLGIRHIEIPATPERVWNAIQTANGGN